MPPHRIDFSPLAENRNQRDDSDPEDSPVDTFTMFSTAPQAHSDGTPAAAALAESPGDAACILVSSIDDGTAPANPSSRRRVSWVHVDTEAAAAAAQAAEAAAHAAKAIKTLRRLHHVICMVYGLLDVLCILFVWLNTIAVLDVVNPWLEIGFLATPWILTSAGFASWLSVGNAGWRKWLERINTVLSFLPCFSLMAALAHGAHTTGGCCRSSLLR